MSKPGKRGKEATNKTYQTQPLFKDKFRPAAARQKIKEYVDKRLEQAVADNEIQNLVREMAEEAKNIVRGLGNDQRYKYVVQAIVGQNKGQGVRMGSRQFWDKDTDNLATVTVVKSSIFVTIVVFALYLY